MTHPIIRHGSLGISTVCTESCVIPGVWEVCTTFHIHVMTIKGNGIGYMQAIRLWKRWKRRRSLRAKLTYYSIRGYLVYEYIHS